MRKLTVKNFSVIKEAELEFGKITVLIGPQSSGKSLLCKLAYFFQYELVGAAVDASTSGQNWDEFAALVGLRFRGWFPLEGWGAEEFQIRLELDRFMVELNGTVSESGDRTIHVQTSDELKNIYLKFTQFSAIPPNRSNPELAQIAAWDEIMHLQNSCHTTSPHFIPAGRASFTNSLGSAVMQTATLEPLIRRFAAEVIWNPAKWMPGLLVSARELPEAFKNAMDYIAGGSVIIRENEPVFKISNDRVLPFSLLSSGTQELLPLFNILNRLVFTHEHTAMYHSLAGNGEAPARPASARPFVFLEEPEAHIFPNTQYEIVRLFAWLTNDPILSFDWVITTHSPYILTAFNTLIEAWRVGNKEGKREQVAAIIPEKYWVNENDFAAYTISDGVLTPIFEKEAEGKEGSGLIDGDFLDSVSDKLGAEFDKLLDIEYAN